MEIKKINLLKFRGARSTLFTGRPQGEDARKVLELDKKDLSEDKFIIIIPKGTTSFNPSFYLGLLFKSIKKLGITKFESKYIFEFEDIDNVERMKVLKENFEDGKRNALNSIENVNIFNRFFK